MNTESYTDWTLVSLSALPEEWIWALSIAVLVGTAVVVRSTRRVDENSQEYREFWGHFSSGILD